MAVTLDRTPTPEQLLKAVHRLIDDGKLKGGDISGGEWTITSDLEGYEGHTRTFSAPEELPALDAHLQRTYDTVALFEPVYEAETSDKRATVKRDTTFTENWMVSRHTCFGLQEYYQGAVLFEDREEAEEYARQWVKRDSVLFSKEDFREGETLI